MVPWWHIIHARPRSVCIFQYWKFLAMLRSKGRLGAISTCLSLITRQIREIYLYDSKIHTFCQTPPYYHVVALIGHERITHELASFLWASILVQLHLVLRQVRVSAHQMPFTRIINEASNLNRRPQIKWLIGSYLGMTDFRRLFATNSRSRKGPCFMQFYP